MTTTTTPRLARCAYYGTKAAPGYYASSDCAAVARRSNSRVCRCERPAAPELAFFRARPELEHDEFYCGCHGWD